jgi:hypothetical protein|nr:MAG TPA: hypothetical protein [Ackermannviridae sp.]
MSQFEKELREELTIRKAKYRVKNSAGKYEVVYLETSADQVEQTAERVFVTPEEKSRITSNKEAIAAETQARTEAVNAINGKLDVINGNEETTGSISKALKDAKAYTDEKVLEINGANSALSGRVEAVEQKVEAVDGKISAAKGEAIESAKTYTDGEIGKIDTAYKTADAKVLEDAKADAQAKVQEAKAALEGSINTVDGKVTALTSKVSANESAISDLRNAISNKNSNTIVVNTEDEIATSNSNPKVGDMAYVISTKRAYIFKGVDALSAKAVPQGWVVFDEITSELDLVDYMKTADANATFRKLSEKIAENDLATELASKINSKLDGTQVDSKISAAISPVSTKVDANEAAITKEVSDRQGEISRVEGLVTSAKQELTSSLTEKETALKAEDTKINNRINKFVPVVAKEEPTETEEGHVWLQLV